MALADTCFELLRLDDLPVLGVMGVVSELLPSVFTEVVLRALVDKRLNWRRRESPMKGIVSSRGLEASQWMGEKNIMN